MEKFLQKNIFSVSKLNISKNLIILISLGGFFIGRISIFHTINPIVVSYLSCLNFSGKSFFLTLLFVIAGIFSKGSGLYFSKYMICVCLLLISNLVFKNNAKNVFLKSLVGSICILISGLIISVLNGFSPYYLMLAVLESVLTGCLTVILNKSINFSLSKNKSVLNTEEIISFILLLSSIVAGASDVSLGSISFTYFFVFFLLLVASYNLGSVFASSLGIICSLLLTLTNSLPLEMMLIFSSAATFSGFLKGKNKYLFCLSFFVSMYIVGFLLGIYLLEKSLFYSNIFAMVLFLVTPFKILRQFDTVNLNQAGNSEYVDKLKDISIKKLTSYANSFEKLSKTFFTFSEKKLNLEQQDISNLIDDVAAKVCSNCKLKNFCWTDNFYGTYQTIFTLLNGCEKTGFVDSSKIPEDFIKRCINISSFIEVLNKTFELYKLNLMWKNKLIDSRELVGQQLIGVSNIITDLSKELEENISFKESLSKKIKFTLDQNGIKTKNIITTENKDKKLEILLKVEPCYIPNGCTKTILPIVDNVVGKKMCRNSYDCLITKENNKDVCSITLIEEQLLRVSTSVATATKDLSKTSGDSHTFMNLPNGNYLLALSDGMGSGSQARAESAASIELFEDFMFAGFDKSIAISMINSVLFLKSSNEIFSTLDICTINLYTGVCEFVKIGAVSTFIIKKDRVEVLRSSSLPVGILNNVEPEVKKVKLSANDIIVMITDGVIDSKSTIINKENWILNILENVTTKNTQEIANLIIEKAKENTKNKIKDDMTVLVSRLWNGYN